MARRPRKPRFGSRLKSRLIAALRAGRWHEDFRRIGNGLIIAGVVTPTLSEQGSFLSGAIIVIIGIILMVLAKTQES